MMEKILPLRQMWQYHLAYGGKGLRSGLCLFLYQALGADPKESLRQRLAWSLFTGPVSDILGLSQGHVPTQLGIPSQESPDNCGVMSHTQLRKSSWNSPGLPRFRHHPESHTLRKVATIVFY